MSTVLKAHICVMCIYYSPLSRIVQCTLFIRELYIAAELSKRNDEWIVISTITFLVLAVVVVVVVVVQWKHEGKKWKLKWNGKLNISCSPTLFGNAFGWYRYEKTALIPQEISIGTVRYWKDSVSVSRFSGQTFQFLSPFLSNGLSFCKTGNVCGKEAGAVLLCQGGHNSNWNRTQLAFLLRLLAWV